MYEDKTPESIKAEILAGLTGWDTREGSFADDMCGPVALELYKMYQCLNAVVPMVWVNETSGKYLDMAAEDLGIEPRKGGVKAAVLLEITGAPGYTVTAGTTFLTADNLCFDTVEDALIPADGVVTATARAQEPGTEYNVNEGAITSCLSGDSRLESVTNPSPAHGGAEQETDAALYARIVAARQRPSTSGNVYDYERWALEVPGVGAAKVYPLHAGPGTVKVLIANENRQAVNDAVLEACAAHIEEARPVGAAVTVKSPTPLVVNVSANVQIEAGTTPEQVRSGFVSALEAYLQSVAFVKTRVLHNRVGALLISLDGVLDYTGLTLNGSGQSLDLEDEQIPVCGEVSFTWI